MQRNFQTAPALFCTGSCSLDGLQALSRYAGSASRHFLRPDYFDEQGRWHRFVEIEGKQVALQVDPSGIVSWKSVERVENDHVQARLARLFVLLPFPKEAATHLPEDLAARFLRVTPLVHVASATLGEALIKAILRQVISATQAKKLLHRFILEYGPSAVDETTSSYGFPSLESIAALPPADLVACGFGYKANILPRIARDLLDTHLEEKIQHLPSETAIEVLQQLKGVGRWTARVAICNLTGDWSVYPFEDLAVRTWAARLWPGIPWPREEKAFLQSWQETNGPSTGIVTCDLLAQANLVSQEQQLEQPALL